MKSAPKQPHSQPQLYEFEAIGTHWAIELLDRQAPTRELIMTVHDTVGQFDQRYSRFRDDSLIAKLARDGELHNPPEELVEMLQFAKQMYDESHGAFTIAVGASLHRMGYGSRRHGRAIRRDIWDGIVISPTHIVAPVGEMLDLGGFGKGWLIDRLCDVLRAAGVHSFIVNGGGDLYCESDVPIEFKLEDPHDETRQFGQTRITRGALAASNTIKRVWHDDAALKHHIIDPDTDDSSNSGVVATYVRADTALIADTMATILILRPELEAALKAKYHLQTILVREQA
jgi:thiamine biosynthesis lipoprotein